MKDSFGFFSIINFKCKYLNLSCKYLRTFKEVFGEHNKGKRKEAIRWKESHLVGFLRESGVSGVVPNERGRYLKGVNADPLTETQFISGNWVIK